MSGPFDRMGTTGGGGAGGQRDASARYILIAMGVIGTLLLILLLPPISLLSGDGNGGGSTGATSDGLPSSGSAATVNGVKLPRVPEGFEALSKQYNLQKPKDTNGPYQLTFPLAQPLTDSRNIGLYTNNDGKWERVGDAALSNNGTAASGLVGDMPANIAVLRRTSSAVQIGGWLAQGGQIDTAALDVLTVASPIDFFPQADGTIGGQATALPTLKGTIMPTIRATAQRETDAVNTILASPQLRDAHVEALVQLSLQQGNGGVVLDYRNIGAARRGDFNTFVQQISDRLHQSGRSLAVTLPLPVKTGVTWETGGYDWEQIAQRADTIYLLGEIDPSVYYARMEDALNYLKPKIDMRRVVLALGRQSIEKGTDGMRALSLREGLTLASTIEVRTTAPITPNSSVVIVGKNLFLDDGASGLRWDDNAFSVAFSYPGRGGQRTVWLENSLSFAFKIDLARRFGMGGVLLDDVSNNEAAPSPWDVLRAFADTGSVNLVAANSSLLKPVWQAQAGQSETQAKGNVVWKAPPQPGTYDMSLIVSDGVIRASQKVVLTVNTQGGTPVAGGTPTATPRPTSTPVR